MVLKMMIWRNFLLLIEASSSIFASALPITTRHLGKIPTPSRYYLPKPPCEVLTLPLEHESRVSDENIRPVYEVAAIFNDHPTVIHHSLPILDTNPDEFTRNPRVQLGESDWKLRKTNKKYPLLDTSPLVPQYGTRYPGINSANVNVGMPRVYSYITVNNIHNNRPFGQYKWTHGFDSDPFGNYSR